MKVRTAELLAERGALPPVLAAASVVGAEESARLFDAAYAEHARRYAERAAHRSDSAARFPRQSPSGRKGVLRQTRF